MVADVVIAGAGPNGLMLACELSLVGQVVRMLDRRGLYQPLAGKTEPPQPIPAFFFGAVPMDLRVLDDNRSICCPCRRPVSSGCWPNALPIWESRSAGATS
jgi:hypothetical protein